VCAIRVRSGAFVFFFYLNFGMFLKSFHDFFILSVLLWWWGQAVAVSSTPLFKTLETTWHFQAASPRSPHPSSNPSTIPPPTPASAATSTSMTDSSDAGPTLLSLDLSFAFANPLHAAVSGAFFGKVSGMMVKAFEERCMEVYGPGIE
jgi:coenzyme Q-binding protein COQ10